MRSEEGQGIVEYGLIVALVAVVALFGLVFLGPKIRGLLNGLGSELTPPAAT